MRTSLPLLMLICLFTGCAGINEQSYNNAVHLQSAIAYLKCGAGNGNSHHYAAGWKKGYQAVMRGADGTPPVVAPQKYWGAFYQCGKGHAAADDWFRGYGDGACAAKQCCGSYVDVPYSANVVGIQDPYYCSQDSCGYACDPYLTEPIVEAPPETYYSEESQTESTETSVESKPDAPSKPNDVPSPPNVDSKGSSGADAPANKPEENSQGQGRFTMPPFESARMPRPLNQGPTSSEYQDPTSNEYRNAIRDLLRSKTNTVRSEQVPVSTSTPPAGESNRVPANRTVPQSLPIIQPDVLPKRREAPAGALPQSSPNYELPAYDAADARYAPVQPALPIK
ncbi:MAG: hypothetical protein AAF497_09075, partial [Planctomycetota bacterium]